MDEYLIGDLVVQVPECGINFYYGPYMERFRCKGLRGYDTIRFSGQMDSLENYLTKLIEKDNGVYQPFLAGNERVLVYHWGKLRYAFAVKPDEFSVLFDKRMLEQVPLNTDWFFGVCGLHRQLLNYGAPILHASYIEWNGKAILFTAPSQTGKSTQAVLWEQYAGARIINGDRVLLRQRKEVWHAYGFPCCGSSKICINQTLPIACIVVLEQGMENRVEEMNQMEKFRALVTGMEHQIGDETETDMIFKLAKQIVNEVRIVRLICRPEMEAVRCLKSYLEREG